MTKAELLEALAQYPDDARMCGAAFEMYGDLVVFPMRLIDEEGKEFEAIVCAGDDELYERAEDDEE